MFSTWIKQQLLSISLYTSQFLFYESRTLSLEITVPKECYRRISESNDVSHRRRAAQDHSVNVKSGMTVVRRSCESRDGVYSRVKDRVVWSRAFSQCFTWIGWSQNITLHFTSKFKSFVPTFVCWKDVVDMMVTTQPWEMYEVMSGDTLSWKVASPRQSGGESSPESHFTGDGGPIKILKVCFCTNNNLGKNFKLVKCDSSWQIRVRVIRKIWGREWTGQKTVM